MSLKSILIGSLIETLEKYSGNLDDKGREELNIIHENVHRMSRLINDPLAFSRSERQQIKSEFVDMNKLARKVRDLVAVQGFEPRTTSKNYQG
jgi:light-regulated signal transduction histidine kinase (bacteriophytochrome)